MAEVRIKAVSKLFGEVKAVDAFDTVVKDGEFVSILGPSGCGKTTMLRMIAGFEKPSMGEIWIGDELVSSAEQNVFLAPEKRNIGMVFQSYAVWPHMNVFENVAYPLTIKKVPKDEIAKRTNHVLGLVHLDQYAERFPNQLSGGQQQRVALARALVSEPKLLLLDEPLSNLDAKLRESMRFEIKELQRKLNITVIYVTHDQSEAMTMSDRIVVMNQGVIQQNDKPVAIYETPVNETVADFIGLVNFVPAELAGDTVLLPTMGGYTVQRRTTCQGKAMVGLRPENILIGKTPTELQGKIVSRFYLGDATDYRVAVGSEVLRVIVKGGSFEEYADGDTVWLSLNKMIVFPCR